MSRRANGPFAKRWLLIGVTVALLVGATACFGDDGEEASGGPAGSSSGGQFGGELEGTEALVGVVVGQERVTVYVCEDGKISEWFITDTPKNKLALVSSGGAVADLAITDEAVTGTIKLTDGSDHEFRATPQSEPVIHRAEAASEDHAVLAGWVTVGDRTTGAINLTPKGGKGAVNPAPPLPTTPVGQITLPTPKTSLTTTLVTIIGDSTFVTPNRAMTFVVAGVGDSYASGEGNPVNAPSSTVVRPSNNSLNTMWGTEFGMNGCHRSDDAGIPRAFRALRTKYQNSGFQFKLAFVACGGSQIEHVTGRPPGVAPPATGDSFGTGTRGDASPDVDPEDEIASEQTDRWTTINEPAQLKQVNDRVAGFGTNLPVDLLVMSIGGNDSGFAPVVGLCVAGGMPANIEGIDPEAQVLATLNPEECDDNAELEEALDEDGPPAGSDIHLVPGWSNVRARYDALDATLEAFAARPAPRGRPIGQVLITKYGAGLKNTNGTAYCGGRSANTADDIFGFIDVDEAEWIDTNLIGGLNTTVDQAVAAANADGVAPSWQAVGAHVGQFANHGPCAAEPWTNINKTALAAQGNNLPDQPEDDTREKLALLNTAVASAKGAAVGCGIGGIVVGVPGCVVGGSVGAGVGLIVGLATNEAESAVSAGMAHPNRKGWEAVGNVLFPEFEAVFKRTFQVLQPTRARQFSAREHGDIVVRWDDKASTESRYEVEIYSMTGSLVARETALPANSTEFTYRPGKAFAGVIQIRACNGVACSPFSIRLKITNIRPGVPINLTALLSANETPLVNFPDSLIVLADDPKNADTESKIELKRITDAAGNTVSVAAQTFNVRAPFPSEFGLGGADGLVEGLYRVRAASCNIFGCSAFSAAKDSTRAAAAPPNLKAELAELPPFVVDKLGLARPRSGTLPPPGPEGPPDTRPGP